MITIVYDHNYTYVYLCSRTFECIMYLNVFQNATFNNCFILFHSLYLFNNSLAEITSYNNLAVVYKLLQLEFIGYI